MGFFFTSVPIFVTLATFIMYSALGNKLTAATAFTSLSLFQIIRFPLLIVPMIITRLIDLAVVNKRLSRFLNAPQRETKPLELPPAGPLRCRYDAVTMPLRCRSRAVTRDETARAPPGRRCPRCATQRRRVRGLDQRAAGQRYASRF